MSLDKFNKYEVPVEVVRGWQKFLVHGPPKSGKSRLLAGMPGPVAAIDLVEGGVQYALSKGRGDRSWHFSIDSNPMDVVELSKELYQAAKKGQFKSIAIDSGTMMWEILKTLTYEAATNDGRSETTFGDWRYSKNPNLKFMMWLMSAPANVGASAWIQEAEGVAVQENPARKAKLVVKKVSRAKTEKSWGYIFDHWIETDYQEDQDGQPNGVFEVSYVGGRIPEGFPKSDLWYGKKWVFDSNKEKLSPEAVWGTIFKPLMDFTPTGTMGYTFIGEMTEEDRKEALEKLISEVNSETLGDMVRMAMSAGSLIEYAGLYEKMLKAKEMTLEPEVKVKWRAVHEQIKRNLQEKK